MNTADSAGSSTYDAFLSYNWQDSLPVETIARRLVELGLRVFFDRWYLVAGQPWQQALAQTIGACRTAVVFLGPQGMGTWQQREVDLALVRQTRDPFFSVIPALLPGGDPALGFLSLNTWVDLHGGVEDPQALAMLGAAIRGEPLGIPRLEEKFRKNIADVCPYRALRPFREEDAAFFFGLEAPTQRLLDVIAKHPWAALVGASGSGKSSVVRAGLVPQLRRSHEGPTWDVVTLLPGYRPLHALTEALMSLLEPQMTEVEQLAEADKLADHLSSHTIGLHEVVARVLRRQFGTDRLLVIVDQWEELYTMVGEESARRRFIDELLAAAMHSPLSIVFTLRGDFYNLAFAYRPLADCLENSVVHLGPMTRDELTRAIRIPAESVGLDFEPGLVPRILDDVGDEPGNLPLLEFVLSGLWKARRGTHMLHQAYDAMGQLRGAVARQAEEVFLSFSSSEREAARLVFMQLVRPGEGTEDTRRRATFAEIGEAARPLVQRLVDARLLVTARGSVIGEETVEVSHEALIGQWARLGGWLNDDREFLLWHQRLRIAIYQWTRVGLDAGALLRGAPLTEAEHWLALRAAQLSDNERAYIVESSDLARRQERAELAQREALLAKAQARHEAEAARAEEAKRSERRAKKFSAFLVVLLLVAVASAVVASISTNRAKVQARRSSSYELAAAAIYNLPIDPERSVLLALYAVSQTFADHTLTPGAEDALHRAIQASRVRLTLSGHANGLHGVAFSPDGKRLATTSVDGTANLWDVVSGRKLLTLSGHTKAAWGVNFGSGGRILATAGEDRTTRLWDALSGRQLDVLYGTSEAIGVALSRDEKRVATGYGDGTAVIWDTTSHKPVLKLIGHAAAVRAIEFAPDGKRLATAGEDQTIRVWDASSGEQLLKLTQGPTMEKGFDTVRGLSFSPDGTRLASASTNHLIKLWEVSSGRELLSITDANAIFAVAYSPDGTRLAAALGDRTAKTWDAGSGKELLTLSGHGDLVLGVAFSPDGTRLATASLDKTAKIWELGARSELLAISGHQGAVWRVVYSPDGTRLATAGRDRTARVWDASSGAPLLAVSGHTDEVKGVAFSPDGRRLATASHDGTAKVWDAATGKELLELQGHVDMVWDIAFSPDGRRLATASFDKTARTWDAATGKELLTLPCPNVVLRLAFSPDGTHLATVSLDQIEVWDLATGNEAFRTKPGPSAVLGVAFSPDGSRLATAMQDGSVAILDANAGTGQLAFAGHNGQILWVTFSPDGKRLATASEDGTAKVWDAVSGRELLVLSGHRGQVTSVAFSPDGKRLATSSDDGSAQLYQMDLLDLIKLAQQRVTRPLTLEECRQYLHTDRCPPAVLP